MRNRLFVLPLVLLAFWSCGDSSLFMSRVDEQAEVRVVTIDAGSMLAAGAEVPVRIERDPLYRGNDATDDRLLVEILDHEDTVLAERTYDGINEATDLPPLRLPDLRDGLYTLRTSYFDGNDLVSEVSIRFFITSGTYRIQGLTSYPASSYPQADGLLRVSLEHPADADPYLVWVLNGEIVESGFLSQTGTTIAVQAPAAQGVFPIRVDLYPVWVDGVDMHDVRAPVTYRGDLFVSNAPSPSRTDLSPRESYFALYHFRGSLRDDGVRTDWFPSRSFSAQAMGTPELVARKDVFGYLLDGSSGFRMDAAVWPAYEGDLSPVSISFRLMPDRLSADTELLRVALRTRDLVTILLDDAGRIGLRLAMLDDEVWSTAPALRLGEAETLTVSIVPGTDSSLIGFYAGGLLVSSHEVPGITIAALGDPRTVAGAGRWSLFEGATTIGAVDSGFTGVIDEFGVFFRDGEQRAAINASLFLDTVRATYGDRLLYALSFDQPTALDHLTVDGDVAIDEGSLLLAGDASVGFPELLFEDEDLVVTLDVVSAFAAETRLFDPGTNELLATVPIPGDRESSEFELLLRHRDGRLWLTIDGTEQEIDADGASFAGVRLELGSSDTENDEEGRLRIVSVVARRDAPQIPRRLLHASDE